MPEEKHARFSPSKLPRIIRCPGSVLLTEALGLEQKSSLAAAEGTYLHAVVESHLVKQEYQVSTILHDDPLIHAEYKEAVEDVLSWVFGMVSTCDVTDISIESKSSMSGYALQCKCPHLHEVYGTVDLSFVKGTTLYVCDWKFGKGIVVEPDSEQLMSYAAGLLKTPYTTEVTNVCCVIIQPRIPGENIKTAELTPAELTRWVQHTLSPALLSIDATEPVLSPSKKACMWCQVSVTCQARLSMANEIASEVFAMHKQLPGTVDATELATLLKKTPFLDQFIKDLNNYAFETLLRGGSIPGYKVVRGRSIRQWTDEEAAKTALEDAGYDTSDLSTVKFFSPTQVEKVITKKKAQEAFFTALVVKPEGKFTLASEEDKREPVNFADATEVFAEHAQIG